MNGGAAHVGNEAVTDVDALLHELPRVEDVGARLELELDRGQLGHRLGANQMQSVEPVERLLERNADQRLHLGGVEPEADRLDLDARWRELREGVHRHVAQLLDAEEHHGGAERDHEQPELHARADDPAHHRSDPPSLVDSTQSQLRSVLFDAAVLDAPQLGGADRHDSRAGGRALR